MSVAKVRASSTSDTMKFEGHISFDNIITQATGKEPFLSFTRVNDPTIPWYHLLTAFDQPGGNKISKGQKTETGISTSVDHCNTIASLSESVSSGKVGGASTKMTKSAVETVPVLKIPEAVVAFAQAAAKANGEPEKYLPGWPLVSPSKFQLQKCAKCSQEFCSSVNYKRHIRTHRKSNIYEKVSPKTREFLATFWDKIPVDEARDLLSFKDSILELEGVAGSSIILELSSWIRKPGFSCLPQIYAKAGITLLDVIQAKPSRFPISSQDFFNILDDASEKTFLCAGTASSLQKFLFDGDVAKIALDMKNLVACTSFILEQKLIKAWHADKDAEALRCQKLLVEEEEAAQKRRAELTERRRRKKLRQKEQKTKDLSNGITGIKDSPEICDSTSFVESITPRVASDVELDSEASYGSSQPFLATNLVFDPKVDIEERHSSGGLSDQNNDHHTLQLDGQREVRSISNRRDSSNGIHSSQVAGVKCMLTEKNFVIKNPKAMSSNGGQKVWTRKIKHESQEMSTNIQAPTNDRMAESLKSIEKPAVLIGTISVSLGDCVCSNNRRNTPSDLPIKSDSNLNHASRSIMKLWRPVSRQGNRDSSTCHSSKAENGDVYNEATSSFETNGICDEATSSSALDNFCPSDGGDDISSGRVDSSMVERAGPSASQLFSCQIAEAFLKQRWEETIASDHVKLILTSDVEYMDCPNAVEEGNCADMDIIQLQHCSGHEHRNAVVGSVQHAGTAGFQKTKLKPKVDKVYRVEYVAKQRNIEIYR